MNSVPKGDRKLRACKVTGLVKTEDQWLQDGNDNIDVLDTRDRELMFEVTSPNFEGLVAMMKPTESWVARWQGIVKLVPGCYALRVRGELSSEHQVTLQDAGIPYYSLEDEHAS
eukprot:CAMPEP_0183349390 /NCGR_PEP_ID=MMETSP0164_2-20130417/13593_1 /TAXON_ID=221442 /ORGANISM="Coccolithus pelagicus ssp braarudi, Strain PLY182g" /LENGTH=113 /DNA_ID=CAMNT_0025521099 /DNA_START=8 /DNA_END=349 /DNA_ORIENTATION=-